MKLILLTVGKPTDNHYLALSEDYLRRIAHYMPIHWEMIKPVSLKTLSEEQVRAKEAELLTAKITAGHFVVALDRSGDEFDSQQFAHWLQRCLHLSNKSLLFIIGGPLGLHPAILAKAHQTLSLSRLTFAHELAAVVFLEQLYRALNFLHGGKYHK